MSDLDLPDDVRADLDEAQALPAFESLPPSHRREHLAAVAEAKRPDTRARRIAWLVAKLRS